MNSPFTEDDRRRGFAGMRNSMSPGARVRRRFTAGRTAAKRDVFLSPLLALSAAVQALTDVLEYMSTQEPSLLPPDNTAVTMIYFLNGEKRPRKSRVHPEDRKRTRELLDKLNALPGFVFIGLTLFIQELVDGSPRVHGWTKPFLWGDDNIAILDSVLEEQLKRFGPAN